MAQNSALAELMAHASEASYVSTTDDYETRWVTGQIAGSSAFGNGYTLFKEFSDQTTEPRQTGVRGRIFVKRDANNNIIEAIVAFTGTELPTPKDILTDLNFAVPQWSAIRSFILGEINSAAYTGSKIHFTGHSLGGALAQFAAYEFLNGAPSKKSLVDFTTFNALGGYTGIQLNPTLFGGSYNPSVLAGVENYHYITTNDFVSTLGAAHLGGNTLHPISPGVVTSDPGIVLDAHLMQHFLSSPNLAGEYTAFSQDYSDIINKFGSKANLLSMALDDGSYSEAEALLRSIAELALPFYVLVGVALVPLSGAAAATVAGFGALVSLSAFSAALVAQSVEQTLPQIQNKTEEMMLWIKTKLGEWQQGAVGDYDALPGDTPTAVRLALQDIFGQAAKEGQTAYASLMGGMHEAVALASGTQDYWSLVDTKQAYADIEAAANQLYTDSTSVGAPNEADILAGYRTVMADVASGYAAILDSFAQAPGMTEQDKIFTTYGLYASMVGDLAFVLPDSNLGLDGSALSAQLSNGLDLTATTMAGLVGSLKESLAGYQLLVGEDIAMAALVEGGVNADSLAGTSSNNLIYGYGSSDFVDGNSGNDVIFGGAGNDTLLGDLGVDTVYGGDGDDELWAGGDEVAAGEILDGGAGSNTLVVWDAKLQNATLSNLQTMWINDYVTLTAAQFAQFSSVNGDATIIAASAGTYDLSEKTVWYGVLNLQGSNGDDYLAGDGEGQTITGGAGNDALQGNGGADTLLGGDGDDDFLTGFSESPTGEVMNGGAGSNRISSWNADLSAATISNIQTLGAHLDYVTLTAAQLSGFNTLIAYGGTPIALNAVGAGTYSLAGKTLSGAFNLNGTTGSDTLAGGTGAQTLSGGTGNDTYLQVRGGGADTVVENDATSGNTDVLQFASDVARDQLWFTQSGNDLMVQIIGTTDSVTVKDWYLGSANHTEQIKAAGGTNTLLDSQVQNLVNAMAGFAVPSTTTLSSAYHTALDPVIAANWT